MIVKSFHSIEPFVDCAGDPQPNSSFQKVVAEHDDGRQRPGTLSSSGRKARPRTGVTPIP